jgi:hypothetical protein
MVNTTRYNLCGHESGRIRTARRLPYEFTAHFPNQWESLPGRKLNYTLNFPAAGSPTTTLFRLNKY